MRRPRRVVSGGQTGVDRAALDVAIALDLEHGGWCPRGRRAEDGTIPARYALSEHASADYAARTEANVVESDATLILHRGEISGGTALTRDLARRAGRPVLLIDLGASPDVAEVRRWVDDHDVRVLNVAGPRESGCPGIGAEASAFLQKALARRDATSPGRRRRLHTGRSIMLAVLGLAGLSACSSPVVMLRGEPVESRRCEDVGVVTHTAFLIGDAGAPALSAGGSGELVDPVLGGLQDDVGRAAAALDPDRVVTLFLGDNVYWDGLPPDGHRDRRHGERVLAAQIAASAPGRAVFLLGNHDWHIEGPEGWSRALEQRRFLEPFAPRVRMLPPGGCAGPERLDLGPHLRFVLIDPIGFGHLADHHDEHVRVCPERTLVEAFFDLAAEFDAHEGRHLALASHHPMITAGPHGGHFGLKQHLFPLTDFWPRAWLPLPVLGSVYPLARQLGVTGTDATSESYARYVQAIHRATRPLVPLLFVGGHEHSLQVHRDILGTYYLVSGAGSASKVDRVWEDMGTLMMATARAGYMRLDVTDHGALVLTVLALDGGERPVPVYAHCLADGPPRPRRASVAGPPS